MTTSTKKAPSRLQKLVLLEREIHQRQLGERDFEYRDHLESLRLRVEAEIKLEQVRFATHQD